MSLTHRDLHFDWKLPPLFLKHEHSSHQYVNWLLGCHLHSQHLARYFHFFSFSAVAMFLLSNCKSSYTCALGNWTHTFPSPLEACATSIPPSTSYHFVTSSFIVFTVMDVLRPCKPKAPKRYFTWTQLDYNYQALHTF